MDPGSGYEVSIAVNGKRVTHVGLEDLDIALGQS